MMSCGTVTPETPQTPSIAKAHVAAAAGQVQGTVLVAEMRKMLEYLSCPRVLIQAAKP
jgi:hypothetical protein